MKLSNFKMLQTNPQEGGKEEEMEVRERGRKKERNPLQSKQTSKFVTLALLRLFSFFSQQFKI
jgi:hypothetical protein